jgi:hypothetical protein
MLKNSYFIELLVGPDRSSYLLIRVSNITTLFFGQKPISPVSVAPLADTTRQWSTRVTRSASPPDPKVL